MSASAPAIPSPTGQSALVRRLRLATDPALFCIGPLPAKARLLLRVNAAPQVRLAGQLRPTAALAVIPLIQPVLDPAQTVAQPERFSAEEREICVRNRDAPAAIRIIAKLQSLVLDPSAARPA